MSGAKEDIDRTKSTRNPMIPRRLSPRYFETQNMIRTARKCISGKRTLANIQVHKLYKMLDRGKKIPEGIDRDMFKNRWNAAVMRDVELARVMAYMNTMPELATDQAFETFFRLMKQRKAVNRNMSKKEFKKLIDDGKKELEKIKMKKQDENEDKTKK